VNSVPTAAMLPQVTGRWRRGWLGLSSSGWLIGFSAAQADAEALAPLSPLSLPDQRRFPRPSPQMQLIHSLRHG
jgi:hypothetical protein